MFSILAEPYPLNRYVSNSPLNATDPSGLGEEDNADEGAPWWNPFGWWENIGQAYWDGAQNWWEHFSSAAQSGPQYHTAGRSLLCAIHPARPRTHPPSLRPPDPTPDPTTGLSLIPVPYTAVHCCQPDRCKNVQKDAKM